MIHSPQNIAQRFLAPRRCAGAEDLKRNRAQFPCLRAETREMITTRCRDALVGKRPRQGPRAEASGAQRAGTRARALSGRMRERGALEQRRGACCAGTGLSYRRASLAGTVGRKGQVRRAEAGVRRVPGTVCWGSSRCILRATTAQRRPAGPKRRPPVRRGCRTAPVPCAPHALPTPNSRGFHCDGNHFRAFKHRFSFVRYSVRTTHQSSYSC